MRPVLPCGDSTPLQEMHYSSKAKCILQELFFKIEFRILNAYVWITPKYNADLERAEKTNTALECRAIQIVKIVNL